MNMKLISLSFQAEIYQIMLKTNVCEAKNVVVKFGKLNLQAAEMY